MNSMLADAKAELPEFVATFALMAAILYSNGDAVTIALALAVLLVLTRGKNVTLNPIMSYVNYRRMYARSSVVETIHTIMPAVLAQCAGALLAVYAYEASATDGTSAIPDWRAWFRKACALAKKR